MLASMSQIDPRADLPPLEWSEMGVSGLLPTGMATLLLADVEGSTRLWETQPDASLVWLVMPVVTAKPRGSSAQHTPSGNTGARCGSKSGTRATKPR
jgi:hypothetical protein